jgi:hypothetical protein
VRLDRCIAQAALLVLLVIRAVALEGETTDELLVY